MYFDLSQDGLAERTRWIGQELNDPSPSPARSHQKILFAGFTCVIRLAWWGSKLYEVLKFRCISICRKMAYPSVQDESVRSSTTRVRVPLGHQLLFCFVLFFLEIFEVVASFLETHIFWLLESRAKRSIPSCEKCQGLSTPSIFVSLRANLPKIWTNEGQTP